MDFDSLIGPQKHWTSLRGQRAATQADIEAAIAALTAADVRAEPAGAVQAAIANLTPEGIGAEPVGAVQAAIAALTAADIDAATLEDLEAAIAIQNFAFPALQNSWEPGFFGSPQIQKQNKMVLLSGSLSNPNFLSHDSVIGLLPPECRPSQAKVLASVAIAQNESGKMVFPMDCFFIAPSGQIIGSILTDSNPLKFLSVSLDNCRYLVD